MPCDHERKLCTKHDAFFCPKCDEWLERKCSDENCEFCQNRPEKPSQVI